MVLTTLVRRSAACVSLAVAQALHTRCDRGVRFGVVADVAGSAARRESV